MNAMKKVLLCSGSRDEKSQVVSVLKLVHELNKDGDLMFEHKFLDEIEIFFGGSSFELSAKVGGVDVSEY